MKVCCRWSSVVVVTFTLLGCGGDVAQSAGAGGGGGDAGRAGQGGAAGTAGDAGDPPFMRPDGGAHYTPEQGDCGFERPAFCETFEQGPAQARGRSGELDGARWSGVRGGPWNPPHLDDGYAVGPARLPACRADLPAAVLPDSDALVCDPIAGIATRHALITAASQNYGLTAYRIRQPFDFAGRTGTIKLDAELVNNFLGGWAAIAISQEPTPAPSFDWEERGSGPRNGIEIELASGWCNTPNTLEVGLYTFAEYEQTTLRPSFDCDTPHTTTARDRLNHVEIYIARDHVEVWASEPSQDGRQFPNFQRLLSADLDLSFTRGYVSLIVRNHATMKYWAGSAAHQRFDNVGFDGPVIDAAHEHSVPDSLTIKHGLDGCLVDGQCLWRGDVIAEHPEGDELCTPETSCEHDAQGRHVGYVVPRRDEPPVSIPIAGVSLAGATSAHLALAASYPWFEWNGVDLPPTAIHLRYRFNGGAWRDRPVSEVEATAFRSFITDMEIAGHGAGLLNQWIEVELSDLREGDNTLELQSDGTWTGDYRVGVLGIDLILRTDG